MKLSSIPAPEKSGGEKDDSMERGSGSIAPTIALITAICLLWVSPICLFHQASAVAYQRVTLSDPHHGSSALTLCDDSHLYAASNSHVAGAGAKTDINLRIEPLRTISHEQFSATGGHEPVGSVFPASRSALLASSKELYVLNVVYQI